MGHICEGCQQDNANLRCSNCTKVWYCSKSCQKTSWWRHKFDCAPEKITTADILLRACMLNIVPEDEDTLRDFRFNSASADDERVVLLGLYQGLIRVLGVTAKVLDRWRQGGQLALEIRRRLESVPAAQRGGFWSKYYRWFIHNQVVLEDESVASTNDRFRDYMLSRAWSYIGGSATMTLAEIRSTVADWDEPTTHCLHFCAFSQSDIPSDPEDNIFFLFGYCTCDGDSAASDLARKYSQLLQLCTFEELVQAFNESKLHWLLRSKGVQYSTRTHPYLEGVLSASPHNIPTVWFLKHFVLKNPITNDPLFNERIDYDSIIREDYGFTNCKNRDEINILKSAYRSFFTDPKMKTKVLELHTACMQGKVYEYLSELIDLRKDGSVLKQLMKNQYPIVSDSSPRDLDRSE